MKRLNGMDALLLYSETPNVHSHTLKIAILSTADPASGADFEAFRRSFQRRLPLLEPLRYKLVEIPGRLHHPMWLQNCTVDLDYHLRRVRVPAPGGRRDLDRVVGEVASTQLDRRHPLWEFYFAEGLADGRWALIGKVHHALADGVASANLLARLLDVDGVGQAAPAADEPCAPPSPVQLLRAAGRDHVRQFAEMPSTVRDVALGSWRLRRRARERGVQPDFAQLMRAPATFLNHVISPARTFASDTLPLANVKITAKHLNVTVNDLVLAMAAGALRTLSLRYDGAADEPIVASVPLSTDQSTDRVTGNEIGGLAVSLPVHISDPLQRLRLVAEATTIAKDSRELFDQELYGRLMGYVPPAVATRALKWVAEHDTSRRLMNIPVSNVAGPRNPGHFDGARVDEIYSVGPLPPGCGMNITVWSYIDQLNLSVITDDVTLADTSEATDALLEAYHEIRSAAGV
ncbi:WS/DGAT/MGAT family O-acyltransferase [Mycobacterium sp. IDR2000157661]|uniref:WS/DGAT/MGAT family O-acyltransferase n=1 Tax=Mycobacterium sp. IDR2000157661 TaxID=2867005 RepID=UPI001EEAE4B7|nr:wax ester/triacylglycerol synthase family O-acyltransferase [Mycobacterium sp. IDR2000157661]ULE33120.1 wax ester/triacylglycerol synthase family O-acyltransferase [Mycobacterium sp. IDR2000157661]